MAGQVNLGHVVGADGQGVPTGGSTGQALVKQSASDYDTTWQKLNTAMPESIAIVANGNTHGAITSGQYVYVRGHATLAEGLYTAKSAIAVNATLSGTNLTAVSGGGLNKVSAELAEMSTDISNRLKRVGTFGGVDADTYTYELPGNGFYCAFIRKTNALSEGTQGLYFVTVNTATSRFLVTPILALGGSMSFTGEFVNDVPTLTLFTSTQTYIYCTIVNIGA